MSNRLPSLAQLTRMGTYNASNTLDVFERAIRLHYPNDEGVSYCGVSRALSRKSDRSKLKRIAAARGALGLEPYVSDPD